MKRPIKKLISALITVTLCLTMLSLLTACDDECSHSYGEWEVVTVPTYTVKGYINRTCTKCGSLQTFELAPLGDEWEYNEVVITSATCTSTGTSKFICRDSRFSPAEFVAVTGPYPHDYSSCEFVSESTHVKTCSGCGHEEVTSHKFTEEVLTYPTCETTGIKELTCEGCGHVGLVEMAVVDHAFSGEWIVDEEATCLDSGSRHHNCVYCNEPFGEDIPKLGHDFVEIEYLAPTCSTLGHTAGTACSRCDVYGEGTSAIPIADHHYVSGTCVWCPEREPLTVTYVYDDTQSETKNVHYGDLFEAISQEGTRYNVFLGWFDESNVEYTASTVITTSIVVRAKWETAIKISTKEDFLQIYDDPTASYYLDADIDMRGAKLEPITGFKGTFDGQKEDGGEHVVMNFIMSSDSSISNYGIFATNDGTIKNVTFKDFTFNGNVSCENGGALGGVVGTNRGTISNVNVDNVKFAVSLNKTYSNKDVRSVTFSIGSYVGRNLGTVEEATILADINVAVTARVSYDGYFQNFYQYHRIGGVCGTNEGKLSGIYADTKASVTVNTKGDEYDYFYVYSYVGGLVGANLANARIEHSYVVTDTTLYGSKSGRSYDYNHCGGFVGLNDSSASIEECFAKGSVKGGVNDLTNLGGFVGNNTATAMISSCYTVMDVSPTRSSSTFSIGGFAGRNSAQIQNSYSDGSVSSSVGAVLGGFVGNNEAGGTITKTYTTADSTASSGSAGAFAGTNAGIISKSYKSDDVIFKPGASSQGSTSLTTEISELVFSTLISEAFLSENLYWDLEGWYVGSDNNPFLEWEFEALHTYDEPKVIEPTCETAGFKVYECKVCGNVFITDVIAPLGHNKTHEYERDKWTAPTHTADGVEAYVCEHEEYGISHTYQVIVPALGHDAPSSISCTELRFEDGEYFFKCSCSTAEEDVFVRLDGSKVAHVAQNVDYVAPLCGAYNESTGAWEGSREGRSAGRVCVDCGCVLAGCLAIEPHVFGESEVVEPATCTSSGTVKRTCTLALCGYEHLVTVDPLPHTYTNGLLKCSTCNAERYVIDQSFTAISSASDLKNMMQNGNYYLTGDVDLASVTFEPLFSEDDPFVGIFLGRGHKITNLKLSADSKQEYLGGIFGAVGAGGKVLGLTVENASVSLNNVNSARVGLIAGVNDGEISMCNVTGTVNVSLVTAVNSKVTGVIATSFDYTFGTLTAVNGRTGEINGCNMSASLLVNYDVATNLSATNVSNYFSQLINNTKISNITAITLGGACGENRGVIRNGKVSGSVIAGMTVASKVGGVNRGRTFTTLTLNEGNFCGINVATIEDCSSSARETFTHGETEESLVSDSCISVLGVVLKQEFYEITDNSVHELLAGMIGLSGPSSVNDLTQIS